MGTEGGDPDSDGGIERRQARGLRRQLQKQVGQQLHGHIRTGQRTDAPAVRSPLYRCRRGCDDQDLDEASE